MRDLHKLNHHPHLPQVLLCCVAWKNADPLSYNRDAMMDKPVLCNSPPMACCVYSVHAAPGH